MALAFRVSLSLDGGPFEKRLTCGLGSIQRSNGTGISGPLGAETLSEGISVR